MVSLKRPHFSLNYCVFFPTVMQILVGRLDSYLLTHTKKYMAPIHALIFEKHVKMCVYIRHIKQPVYIYDTFGGLRTAKKVGWEVIFSEHGFAGSGARKPRWELENSALDLFCSLFCGLRGLQLCR